MSSALIRKIYRGWNRGESFWDTLGMDENLRTIGDHLPLKITVIGGTRPAEATEGFCWIDPATGAYSVWSTGNKLEPASWHDYSGEQALIGYNTAAGDMWANTGSAWVNITQIMKDWVLANSMDYSEVLAAIAAALRNGTNTTVTGVGSPADPYKVNVVSDEIEIIGRAYKHTSVDGTSVVIDPAQFKSLDADNAIGIGSDGGLKVLIPVYFEDGVLGGSNAGTVDITLTPTVDPESGIDNYIISADLKVAVSTPSGQTNALLWSASGFYVAVATDTVQGVSSLAVASNFPSSSNTESATPGYVAAAIGNAVNLASGTNTTLSGAGTPADPFKYSVATASDSTQGISSLAVASNFPSSSDTESATPAYVAAAIGNAVNLSSGTNTSLSGTGTPADPFKYSVETATDTVPGISSLAVASNFPSSSNTEAATPGYVASAVLDGVNLAIAVATQSLSISGHTLSISGANSITLPDNDVQTLAVSGTTGIAISNGNTITLLDCFE